MKTKMKSFFEVQNQTNKIIKTKAFVKCMNNIHLTLLWWKLLFQQWKQENINHRKTFCFIMRKTSSISKIKVHELQLTVKTFMILRILSKHSIFIWTVMRLNQIERNQSLINVGSSFVVFQEGWNICLWNRT